MIMIRRSLQKAKGVIIRFRSSFALTAIVRHFVQLSMLILMLLPCIAFSQQDTIEQYLSNFWQEEVKNSSIIIEAQVVSKECKWDSSEGRKDIYTAIKFKILQTIKGVVGTNEFTFNQLGGQIGKLRIDYSSSKDYALNERAIYFIKNKDLTGYLHESKVPIQNGKVGVEFERIDADFFIKVLKKSITDVTVIPRFANMITKMKEVKEWKKTHPHKVIAIPNPLEDIKTQ
ncbi:MAG: hypothetical protein JXA06_08740 [Bacteroidetes bacterium]|nr:hypothetical protein [Bacteroidota bacterium]